MKGCWKETGIDEDYSKVGIMRIKVLHIIGSGTIGGAQNFVYQLANYQHKNDCEVEPTIFFRKGSGYFYKKSVQNQLNTFSCKEKIVIKDFIAISRYLGSFDVLHFHGLYPVLLFAAIISRCKSIYYVHGARALTKSFETVIKESIAVGPKRNLPTFKGLIRFIKRQWFIFFLKYIFKSIHAPSKYYVDFYIKKYGVPKRKISHLPLGIDLLFFQPTKTIKEVKKEIGIKEEKIIGCVSTFRGLKRIDRLIDGFAEFLKDDGKNKAKLVIVGDGAERESLEEKIEQNQLIADVILTGFRKDIPNLLNIMDIFVLPSEFENFPLSIVEAMYFSLPFIVFQGSGGAEELADKSGVGIIVNNERELADKIKYLLNNNVKAEKLGSKGHQFVIKNLTIESFANNIKEAYKALSTS